MTEDLLKRATAALREGGDTVHTGARTRARILYSLHEQKRRRRTRWALGIPVLALFAGSTAFASATGKLPDVTRLLSALVSSESADVLPPPADPTRAAAKPSIAPPAVSALEPELDEPSEAPESIPPARVPQKIEPPEPKRAATLPHTRRLSHAATAASSTSSASAPASRGTLDLYRSAHRAQFVARDPELALRNYDAYLAAAPHGELAQEARYNRGLCLLRLGRHADARRALTPFAEGRFNGYRQREATRLIDATRDAGVDSAREAE